MIVGHFFLAFALTVMIARYSALEKTEVVQLGLLAGVLTLLPDIDILYAFREVIVLLGSGFYSFTNSFWDASQIAHRGATHSLITLFLTSIGLGLYHKTRSKTFAALFSALITLSVLIFSDIFSAGVTALFLIASFTATELIGLSYDIKYFLLACLFGLVLHPLGDVFTGVPPEILFPLGLTVLESRIVMHPDPVLNLLIILGLELSLGWMAVTAYFNLSDNKISKYMTPLSFLGVFYIAAAFFIRRPTLSTSYQLVFSLLAFSTFLTLLISWFKSEKSLKYILVNLFTIFSLGAMSYTIYYLV